MGSLRGLLRTLRWFTLAIIVFQFLIIAWAVVGRGERLQLGMVILSGSKHAPFGNWIVVGAVAPLVALAISMVYLWLLLGEFLRNQFYSDAATRRFRNFSGWLLASVLFNIVGEVAAESAISESGCLIINLSGANFFGLFLSLVLLIVASVLVKGKEYREELERYF